MGTHHYCGSQWDAALVFLITKAPRKLHPTHLSSNTDPPRHHEHQTKPYQSIKEHKHHANKLQISHYKNKHRKKPKPNLTPKKIKTILDWTKQESIKTNEYKQKLTHLDTGWGNIPDSKDNNIFRIIAGNINGLSTDNYSQPKLHEILTNSTTMEADALLFQETNTDFKKIQPMNSLQQTMKLYHQTHATSISNSTVPAKNKNWLPGGTISSVLGRWTGAKITPGNDYPLGRWSWISLKGRGDKIIA